MTCGNSLSKTQINMIKQQASLLKPLVWKARSSRLSQPNLAGLLGLGLPRKLRADSRVWCTSTLMLTLLLFLLLQMLTLLLLWLRMGLLATWSPTTTRLSRSARLLLLSTVSLLLCRCSKGVPESQVICGRLECRGYIGIAIVLICYLPSVLHSDTSSHASFNSHPVFSGVFLIHATSYPTTPRVPMTMGKLSPKYKTVTMHETNLSS
jgi:hypothetical protein